MTTAQHVSFLHAWISRLPKETEREKLYQFAVKEFSPLSSRQLPAQKVPDFPSSRIYSFWLHRIHSTWISSWLMQYDSSLFPLLASPFTKQQQEALQKEVKTTWSFVSLAPCLSDFFAYFAFRIFSPSDSLPLSFLQTTAHFSLFSLSPSLLSDVIDLLLIRELAAQWKLIIDSSIIKAMTQSLSEKQKQYLSLCLKRKSSFKSISRGFFWKKRTVREWKKEIRRENIAYFCSVLIPDNPSLLWYLMRSLDKSDAVFFEQCQKESKGPVKQAIFEERKKHLTLLVQHLTQKKG